MLGHTLVTKQTGPAGRKVHRVYVEAGCDIARELYLSLLVDRATSRVTIMASTEGGMEIEEVAEHHPEKILRVAVDPASGISGFHARRLAFGARPDRQADRRLRQVRRRRCTRPSSALDCAIVEINPLVVTGAGDVVALDAKVSFDDNALFRHPELEKLRDEAEEDPKELEAAKHSLNYVALDGNIGCMVNGAGLAMATMDIIKLYGAAPANFLDVGGGATKERVTAAFKIILSDPNVEGILVNIFGGIMRCDVIAEGVVAAAREVIAERAAGGAPGGHQRRTRQGDHGQVRPADHLRRQPRRRRRKGRQGREGSRLMAILVDANTTRHHPGLHRRPGHLPFRAGDRLRHQGGRRRHPGQGRHARISTCRCSTPWPRRWRRPAPPPPPSTCRRRSPPTPSWKRSTPRSR